MPSTLPTISVRTSPDNIVKIKEIAKYHGRSVSNEVERLIEDHIAKFEKEHGVITIYNMTPGRNHRGHKRQNSIKTAIWR